MLKYLVVGTDTGVGKTVFTGLLGYYLIKIKEFSVNLQKPFCSGGKSDIEFLQACSVNYSHVFNFKYYEQPISPAAAELRTGDLIDFESSLRGINHFASKKLNHSSANQTESFDICNVSLIEGVGGLLAPLTKNRSIAALAQGLMAKLILVAPNKVGVVNHVLLTVEASLSRGLSVDFVVLMEQEKPDLSSIDNAELIKLHMPVMDDFKGVFKFPWLGLGADDPALIEKNLNKTVEVLDEIFETCILPNLVGGKC